MMTVSTGLKILAISSLLLVFAAPVRAESDLSPDAKAKIAAMAASAKTVQIKEAAPAPPAGKIDAIDASELQDVEEIPPAVAEDSAEIEPLRVSLDKPEIVRLDRDAVNVIVGSNENLRVVPDTNKTLVLIAKKPGSTYFRALDVDGKVIMQRHVIIGSPNKNYIRIRRACANGAAGCKQYSVYYCPDMCHEVNVVQDVTSAAPAIPEATPMGTQAGTASKADESEEPLTTPKTTEPPPGE